MKRMDFYCASERQAIHSTARRLGIEITIKFVEVNRCDTSTKGKSRLGFLKRNQLVQMIEHFEKRFKETNHYSSKQAIPKFKKLLKKFDEN